MNAASCVYVMAPQPNGKEEPKQSVNESSIDLHAKPREMIVMEGVEGHCEKCDRVFK